MKIKVMKTIKKRKALRIHDPKKMMNNGGPGLGGSGAGGVLVLLVEVLAKKHQFEVEITARGGSSSVGSGGKFMERG